MTTMNDSDSIREFLPQTGWLAKYVELTDGLSACPRFRFFSAVCCLGAAINNKVSIQRGTTGTLFPKFFPNLWVILLAPPGRGYKTSTINMACNLLHKACTEVRIISDKITPEAIVSALSMPKTPKETIRIGPRDATGLIKAPEMSVFFGKQQYNLALVTLITDLYDFRETWSSETIGRGKDVLKNVCLSILGGSTPQWLQHMLPSDAFTGGFMSRFIIVEIPPTYYVRKAFPSEPTKVQWMSLIEELTHIGSLTGEMQWTTEARDLYQNVYESFLPCGDAQVDAYREREAEQILRLAMALALSRSQLTVEARDFNRAKKLITCLEKEANPRIERLTTHPRMSLTQEVLDLLRLHGELSELDLLTKLYRFLSHGEAQFYEAVGILRRTKTIVASGKPGNYVFSINKGKKK